MASNWWLLTVHFVCTSKVQLFTKSTPKAGILASCHGRKGAPLLGSHDALKL